MTEKAKSAYFPLLLIPDNVLEQVLRSMEVRALILISFISRKIKPIAVALNMKPIHVDVVVLEFGRIYIGRDVVLCTFNRTQHPTRSADPYRETLRFIAHIFLLTKQTNVRRMRFFRYVDEAILNTVFHLFPNCENISINSDISSPVLQKILSLYGNATKQISLHCIPPVEFKNPILIQNWDYLGIHTTPSELDDLLMINCAALGVIYMSPGNLNKFLKMWIQNKANCRLEHFWIERWGADLAPIMNGIHHTEIPRETIRTFKHSKKAIALERMWTMPETVEVQGGFDFRKRDGTLGTITIREQERKRILEFFVWS